MEIRSFKHTLWNQFIALESDFAECLRYVAFSEANMKTYSTQFSILLLSVCSEVDVTLNGIRGLVSQENGSRNNPTIADYREMIQNEDSPHRDIFHNLMWSAIGVNYNDILIHPWISWATDDGNPSWWKAYNNVKHNRGDHFSEANMKNVLFAFSGLLSALTVYYKLSGESLLFPAPSYFSTAPILAAPATFNGGVHGINVSDRGTRNYAEYQYRIERLSGINNSSLNHAAQTIFESPQKVLTDTGEIVTSTEHYLSLGWKPATR